MRIDLFDFPDKNQHIEEFKIKVPFILTLHQGTENNLDVIYNLNIIW